MKIVLLAFVLASMIIASALFLEREDGLLTCSSPPSCLSGSPSTTTTITTETIVSRYTAIQTTTTVRNVSTTVTETNVTTKNVVLTSTKTVNVTLVGPNTQP